MAASVARLVGLKDFLDRSLEEVAPRELPFVTLPPCAAAVAAAVIPHHHIVDDAVVNDDPGLRAVPLRVSCEDVRHLPRVALRGDAAAGALVDVVIQDAQAGI